MPKFRKKPIVIEAVQWFKDGDHPAVIKQCLPSNENTMLGESQNFIDHFFVLTLEGTMEVTPGDWIITGIKGEMYPCKPDIFEMTYDAVEETK